MREIIRASIRGHFLSYFTDPPLDSHDPLWFYLLSHVRPRSSYTFVLYPLSCGTEGSRATGSLCTGCRGSPLCTPSPPSPLLSVPRYPHIHTFLVLKSRRCVCILCVFGLFKYRDLCCLYWIILFVGMKEYMRIVTTSTRGPTRKVLPAVYFVTGLQNTIKNRTKG